MLPPSPNPNSNSNNSNNYLGSGNSPNANDYPQFSQIMDKGNNNQDNPPEDYTPPVYEPLIVKNNGKINV